jgi:hypothetical protein
MRLFDRYGLDDSVKVVAHRCYASKAFCFNVMSMMMMMSIEYKRLILISNSDYKTKTFLWVKRF